MIPSSQRHDEVSPRTRYLRQCVQSTFPSVTSKAHGTWSAEEHGRFLLGMEQFPMGPWSAIAEIVGTRSVRQVHSHAQKYAAKVERHKRGHRKIKRSWEEDGERKQMGHRVETNISGKFVKYVVPRTSYSSPDQSDASSSRSSDDEGNGDEESGEHQTFWTGSLIQDPDVVHASASRCQAGVRKIQRRSRSLYDDYPSVPLRFDINPHTKSDVLPTFDESLDFFINRFLFSEEYSTADEKVTTAGTGTQSIVRSLFE